MQTMFVHALNGVKIGNPIMTIPAKSKTPAGSLINSLIKTNKPPKIAIIGTKDKVEY